MNWVLVLSIAVAAALATGFLIWAAREVKLMLRWLSQPLSMSATDSQDRDLQRAYEELLSQ